jgi:lycopene cyclase domain-containing protein
MTYILLSAAFLAIAATVLVFALIARGSRALVRRWIPAVGLAAAALLVLTAVFDNIMISAGLMSYDLSLTTGAAIGVAPIEDFAYPLAAVILLPSLWLLFRGTPDDDR